MSEVPGELRVLSGSLVEAVDLSVWVARGVGFNGSCSSLSLTESGLRVIYYK